MPKLSMAVPHNLPQDEVTRRLMSRFDELREQHGHQLHDFEGEWNGGMLKYRFQTMGVHVSGAVTVGPSQVTVDAHLPLLAMMFKGTIEQQIRSELGSALA